MVAEAVKQEIDHPYRKKPVAFQVSPDTEQVVYSSYSWRVPESFANPIPLSQIRDWDTGLYRIPIAGWRRSVYEAAAFDSGPELRVAQILDRSPTVARWVRNDPPRLRIATPIGFYEPDFVVLRITPAGQVFTIIEVKRGDLWTPQESDPRVKARAATAWCDAVSSAGSTKWEHWVILDADTSAASSLEDLEQMRVDVPGSESR